MKPNSEYLRELRKSFLRLAVKLDIKIRILCFYEMVPTDYGKMLGVNRTALSKIFSMTLPTAIQEFVSEKSATLGHEERGLHRAHRDLVQFEGIKDAQYNIVRSAITKEVMTGINVAAKDRFNSFRNINMGLVTGVLAALEGVPIKNKYNALRNKVVCQSWILEEPEYEDWAKLETGDCVDVRGLWIFGSEGKGKTSALMASIETIDDRATTSASQSTKPVVSAFFLCDKSAECSSAEELLKSIIRQLVGQKMTLAPYARHFTGKGDENRKTGSTKDQSNSQASLTVENLWQSLLGMFTDNLVGTIYIMLNNIHELSGEDTSTKTFLDLLKKELSGYWKPGRRVKARWLFTGRPREHLRSVFAHENVQGIDLSNDKYKEKVKSDVQRHAETKFQELQAEKQYSMALSYFAGSLIGKRAETTKWVDVTCVHLAALPLHSSDLEVRHLLEEVPDSLVDLLDHTWQSLLNKPGTETAKVKEMLRTLILTYEDPTIEELAVLAGLSSNPSNLETKPQLSSS
ncbi:hypothetical protein BO94DRAFT_346353 [Aspergillus sclerotioniger CBS 115572]|uniref:Nephrocystin 3-like N-terminal domain-containing protein n=1 Tax=Aspergillus sclerotioniger CBS 115572 TaxID=1450535 RepID=A0A317X4N0_9EURO|nr:hypothetical protein BO94DRAFT_346353 [Aspergillus sclerotioniger CBS 115572]PWY93559.1 hypothetical protein BO94DRAFT_346353 [Aspergillus sclerotioniger CBS 115572]